MISINSQEIDLKGIFNPTKYDKYSFIKHEIVTEEQITSDSLFLQDFSRVIFPNFVFQVSENRMLVSIIDADIKDIKEVLTKIIQIENFEIISSSINLEYLLSLETDNDTLEISKNFRNEKNKIQQKHFSSDDCQFGFYASKNFLNTRLKLDVHPSNLQSEYENKKIILFDFKFQNEFNIAETNNQLKLIEIINNYDSLKEECEKIIQELKN